MTVRPYKRQWPVLSYRVATLMETRAQSCVMQAMRQLAQLYLHVKLPPRLGMQRRLRVIGVLMHTIGRAFTAGRAQTPLVSLGRSEARAVPKPTVSAKAVPSTSPRAQHGAPDALGCATKAIHYMA